MTTGSKVWDLTVRPQDDPRPRLVGHALYSNPARPAQEFGSGSHRVVLGWFTNEPEHEFLVTDSLPWMPSTMDVFGARRTSWLASDVELELMSAPFSAVYPLQSDVLEAIEELRSRLDLTVETTARLLGVEKRAYQGWKAGALMPIARLQAAVNAAVVLGRLTTVDLAATRKALEDNVEAATLVATGQFGALRALVDRARAAIAHQMAAISPAIEAPLTLPEGVQAERALELLSSPDFGAVITYLEALAPEAHATEAIWKARAMLELQRAIERLSSGDELGDSWLFLVALSRADLDALEERARVQLRSVDTTEESWTQFLADEAEVAWSRYSVTEVEPAEMGSHDPDADLRPADLYEFSHFGFDLATGRAREAG